MDVEEKSDWLATQIELLKTLHLYEKSGINNEVGSIDYVSSVDGAEKRLLSVIIDPKANVSKADAVTIKAIKGSLDNENYDEAVILAEEVTQGAKSLIKDKKNLHYISQDLVRPYSISELIYAIQKKSGELCKIRCGKVPESKKDCQGYQDREYTCQTRRISDDADFHADRKWPQLLMNDFSKLVILERSFYE
jgi:hypothetical protein